MSATYRPRAENPIFTDMRTKLLERSGKSGIRSLAAAFRIADDNNNGFLEPDEVRKTLREKGVALTDAQFEEVTSRFDVNGDGRISYDEFLIGLRGELNARRKRVVDSAFARMDVSKNGTIELNDVFEYYDASRHPAVQSGKVSETDIMMKFMSMFDDQTNPDGKVTYNEFLNYYCGVSANIDNDQHFELLIIRAWNLDNPAPIPRSQRQQQTAESTMGGSLSKLGRSSPLYASSSQAWGANLENAFSVETKHRRTGEFTRTEPQRVPSTALNTSVSRSRVIN